MRLVPLKMLPFDNKNEFQIVVDMPEGTTLEATDAVVAGNSSTSSAQCLKSPVSCRASATASPIDFNGMVRQYYLRERGPTWPTSGEPARQKTGVRSKATPSYCG
jgi:hypothetical protein